MEHLLSHGKLFQEFTVVITSFTLKLCRHIGLWKGKKSRIQIECDTNYSCGPTPTTLLFSLPSSIGSEVQEGDTITFSGQLVTKDIQTGKISSIPGATIYIYDNVSLGKDTLIGKAVTNDPTGIFGFTWKAVPRIYSGDYQFYASFAGTSDYGKVRSQEYGLKSRIR